MREGGIQKMIGSADQRGMLRRGRVPVLHHHDAATKVDAGLVPLRPLALHRLFRLVICLVPRIDD